MASRFPTLRSKIPEEGLAQYWHDRWLEAMEDNCELRKRIKELEKETGKDKPVLNHDQCFQMMGVY